MSTKKKKKNVWFVYDNKCNIMWTRNWAKNLNAQEKKTVEFGGREDPCTDCNTFFVGRHNYNGNLLNEFGYKFEI